MFNIINIGTSTVNCFVIEHGDKVGILDSGYYGGFDKFKTKFEELGYNADSIAYLFLTHCHGDHIGFLDKIMDYTTAPLILHEQAVPRLLLGSDGTFLASTKLVQMLSRLVANRKPPIPIIDRKDRYLVFTGSEQYIEDMGFTGHIVELSGHTADSIGILADKVLLCGDSVFNTFYSKKYHPLVLEDLDKLYKTWEYIVANSITIIPSHGKPMPSEKLAKYINLLDKNRIYSI